MRKLLTGLVVLAGLLLAVDRVTAFLASRAVAHDIAGAETDCREPGVDIGGFPFLTQAIAGRYDDVTISTSCTVGSSVRLDPVQVELFGAHLGLGQIAQQHVDRVPVERIVGSATIPFAELDRAADGGQLRFGAGPGGSLTVTGSLTVGGQTVSAHGSGQLSVVTGELRITISSSAGGTFAGGAPDVLIPVPLPFHLTEASVHANAAGVVISGVARNVVLQK